MNFEHFNIPHNHKYSNTNVYMNVKTCICKKYTIKELEHCNEDDLHTKNICLENIPIIMCIYDINDNNDINDNILNIEYL